MENEMEDSHPELYQLEEETYDALTIEKWREWSWRVRRSGSVLVAFMGEQVMYDLLMQGPQGQLIDHYMPSTKHEDVLDGLMGNLDGVLLIADYVLHPILKLLDDNELFVTCIEVDEGFFSSESVQLALSMAIDQEAKILHIKRSSDLKQWTREEVSAAADEDETE